MVRWKLTLTLLEGNHFQHRTFSHWFDSKIGNMANCDIRRIPRQNTQADNSSYRFSLILSDRAIASTNCSSMNVRIGWISRNFDEHSDEQNWNRRERHDESTHLHLRCIMMKLLETPLSNAKWSRPYIGEWSPPMRAECQWNYRWLSESNRFASIFQWASVAHLLWELHKSNWFDVFVQALDFFLFALLYRWLATIARDKIREHSLFWTDVQLINCQWASQSYAQNLNQYEWDAFLIVALCRCPNMSVSLFLPSFDHLCLS